MVKHTVFQRFVSDKKKLKKDKILALFLRFKGAKGDGKANAVKTLTLRSL